jgi:predicted ATPase
MTMRAEIDWSYDLLSETEQRVFRGLGMFAGSFELGAAESISATHSWTSCSH